MKIYIIGFMGSGKSSYGKELAEDMGYDFFDLDTEIEKQAKASIATLFEEKGEDFFRKLEREVLLKTLDLDDNVVIATGGGTPCFFDNIKWMNENGETVYLKLFEPELKKHLLPVMADRPLLKNIDPDELDNFIYRTLRARALFYHQAKVVIDPTAIKPEALAGVLRGKIV